MDDISKRSTGRSVVLFPGAFRPPHINHFNTVRDLALRSDVDEVVIIITNRCRSVPGTDRVLDVDIAVRIWTMYLSALPKVRVEVAPVGAVKHALNYIERAAAGNRLLYCLGEADLQVGDRRFKKIYARAQEHGIEVAVVAGSPNAVPIRATDLRQLLTQDQDGREQFIGALPSHLTMVQREQVWEICRAGMVDMRTVTTHKVAALVAAQGFDAVGGITIARKKENDEVYVARLATGERVFIKYAHDTVKAARIGVAGNAKPRKRIKVEREAIKWMRANVISEVEIPEVLCYCKETKALFLSEVCPDGHFLQDDLEAGVFDVAVVGRAAKFLAQCHATDAEPEPFWEERGADIEHWRTMLALRTVEMDDAMISAPIRCDLKGLRDASDAAAITGYVHLDYCPKNIRISERRLGMIDFELSATFGDPAYDLGYFFTHFIVWGTAFPSNLAFRDALQTACDAYRDEIGARWPGLRGRAVSFAGAGILDVLLRGRKPALSASAPRLAMIAARLIAEGFRNEKDAERVLFAALAAGD